MFEDSLLTKTAQTWKVLLSSATVICGGIVMLTGIFRESALPGIGGFLIATVGFSLLCTAVKCPSCNARWAWIALSTQGVGKWFDWLIRLNECPKCKSTHPQSAA